MLVICSLWWHSSATICKMSIYMKTCQLDISICQMLWYVCIYQYTYISLSKLVKQCFIELLCRMTKILFLSPCIQINLNFLFKHPKKVCSCQFLVITKCIIFVFIYYLYGTLWKNCTKTVGTITLKNSVSVYSSLLLH